MGFHGTVFLLAADPNGLCLTKVKTRLTKCQGRPPSGAFQKLLQLSLFRFFSRPLVALFHAPQKRPGGSSMDPPGKSNSQRDSFGSVCSAKAGTPPRSISLLRLGTPKKGRSRLLLEARHVFEHGHEGEEVLLSLSFRLHGPPELADESRHGQGNIFRPARFKHDVEIFGHL